MESTVISLAARYVGLEQARDVAQDVALAAIRRLPSFPHIKAFGSWACKRARGLALDRIRLRLRDPEFIDELDAVSSTSDDHEALLRQIATIVAELPERQRMVMERTLSGQSDGETAESLAITPQTVRSLRRHARYRMTAELEEWGA